MCERQKEGPGKPTDFLSACSPNSSFAILTDGGSEAGSCPTGAEARKSDGCPGGGPDHRTTPRSSPRLLRYHDEVRAYAVWFAGKRKLVPPQLPDDNFAHHWYWS